MPMTHEAISMHIHGSVSEMCFILDEVNLDALY